MQCKDIPDAPVLRFLTDLPPWEDGRPRTWANWYAPSPAAVQNAMPPGVPDRLALAKMRQMIRRGVVTGCPCGCRGDFEITDKGRAELASGPSRPSPATP